MWAWAEAVPEMPCPWLRTLQAAAAELSSLQLSSGAALAAGRTLTLTLSVSVWVVNATQLPVTAGILCLEAKAADALMTGSAEEGGPVGVACWWWCGEGVAGSAEEGGPHSGFVVVRRLLAPPGLQRALLGLKQQPCAAVRPPAGAVFDDVSGILQRSEQHGGRQPQPAQPDHHELQHSGTEGGARVRVQGSAVGARVQRGMT
jgi:hypothetical protein